MSDQVTKPEVTPTPPAPAGGEGRPAWLPEKFQTPEALAQAYTELQKKLGSQGQQPPATPEAPKKQGLDSTVLGREIAEHGKVTDATLQSLKDAGYDDSTITTHVEGIKAVAQRTRSALAEAAGSEDALKAVSEWAKTGLSNEQAQAFDAALQSGNITLAQMAIRDARARYVEAEGNDPGLLKGETATTTADKPFDNSKEVSQAMRDPKYKKDPTYRAEVQRRLAASKLFNLR